MSYIPYEKGDYSMIPEVKNDSWSTDLIIYTFHALPSFYSLLDYFAISRV